MENRRQHSRKEVGIDTRLFLPSPSPRVVLCRIIDVSEGGVKVQMNTNYRLPSQLVLMRGENENMYECRLAWQVERTAGLMFISVCGRAKHQEMLEQAARARVVVADDRNHT